MSQTDLTNVPDASAVPDTGDLPEWYAPINNLAGDTELCGKFSSWSKKNYNNFRAQATRKEWCDTGGKMDSYDKMERCSLRKKTSSAQDENTKSNMPSTIAFRNARTIYSNLCNMFGFINTEELPAKYEPKQNSTIFRTPADGKFVAKQQNMLGRLTFEDDQRREKGKKHMWSLVKYGNLVLWDEWERKVETQNVRKVVEWEEGEGGVRLPKKWTWIEKDVVTKDCPSLSMIDMKDAYFDSQLDEVEDWRAFFVRGQKPWETLASDQKQGFLMNVDKLTANQLYTGEDGESDTLADRSNNAGEQGFTEATGLWEVWQEWGFVPIKEKMRKGKTTGKGTWDDKNPPVLYWGTFAGPIDGKGQVCLRLVKCPYNLKKIPVEMVHLLRDDKGAYHDGLFTRTEALYWQSTSNINQANDNVNLVNLAPWWTDGIVKPRNLKSRANKLLQVSRGSTLAQLAVNNNVPATMSLNELTESNFESTTGADKAVSGEIAFSRTSATESQNSLDQSLLPIDDMASFVGGQYFPFYMTWDKEHWRQYGDPETILTVTHNNLDYEIKPAHLYGPLKVSVTAVNRFRNNRSRRIELNNLIGGFWTSASADATPAGRRLFNRWVFTQFKIPIAAEVFPIDEEYDAISVAMGEVESMLMRGEFVEPMPQQNQKAHLSVERAKLAQYKTLSNDDTGFNADWAAQLAQHIAIEEEMIAQKETATSGQQDASEQLQGEGEALPGEVAGDGIAATEGAIANG